MPNKREFTINFQPIGKRVVIEPSQSILEAAQSEGIGLASICGGVGVCDSCKIRLINGHVTKLSLEEEALFSENEIQSGFRLACQSYPLSDLTIEIPPESLTAPQRLQIEGQSQLIQIDPPVIPIELEMPEPSISDLRADTIRVRAQLEDNGFVKPVEFQYQVLKNISPLLRNYKWHVTLAMRNNSIVAILPTRTHFLGLAIDVGTTKLATYLCDLETGNILAKSGAMNPQTAFGEDVISRISYSNNTTNGNNVLQKRLIDALNILIDELCLSAKESDPSIVYDHIVEAVIVGNTAMHHLFAGLPVWQLGVAPYVPAVSEPLEIGAEVVNLHIAPGAMIYMPPNIAGYVGADHVAMLLATNLSNSKKTAIALDIGTNTEISLFHHGQLFSCSCASGPAFEGAHIHAGMRAAPGAIERVQVIQGELKIQTIDNFDPIGICGSGILDAIACLREIGAVDQRGSFVPNHPAIHQADHKSEYVIADAKQSGNGKDVIITRQDINEIQLAKGAIRTGIEVLLNVAGIKSEMIEDFIIAGAFGTYINIPSAIRIGMFPQLPLNRFRQVGNAAGAGARQMLLSIEQRQIAKEIARQVQYIELATYPNFANIFSKSLFL